MAKDMYNIPPMAHRVARKLDRAAADQRLGGGMHLREAGTYGERQ
jgi:hypothetical protein